MSIRKERPVYLDIRRIHLPVTAVASLGHRIAGILLFLALAPALYLLHISLQSAEGYADASALLRAAAPVLVTLLAWAGAHHLLAGVRLLFQDVHLGVALPTARSSARWVIALGVFAALMTVVVTW